MHGRANERVNPFATGSTRGRIMRGNRRSRGGMRGGSQPLSRGSIASLVRQIIKESESIIKRVETSPNKIVQFYRD